METLRRARQGLSPTVGVAIGLGSVAFLGASFLCFKILLLTFGR